MPARTLCVDVGSTFTKACLVGPDGRLVGTAQAPTSLATDVMEGVRAAAAQLGAVPDPHTLACSSAGGGLRLAVVGYERQVTAEAAHRVGLSAGARVVHLAAGPLDDAATGALHAAAPDLVLLAGGTDGGNDDVLRHNASALAAAGLGVPVVVAGNVDARDVVLAVLEAAGQPVLPADNVVPQIGVIAPESARAAIRAAFLRHVIGGKGLSVDPLFTQIVRAPTPDAVLSGVEVLAAAMGDDVLVVDIGGATTDVYSVVTPQGEDAGRRREVVAPVRLARTVEGDLGVRWNADGIVAAARREGLPVGSELVAYASEVAADPGRLPRTVGEGRLDLELARLAALVAVRRHGRPASAGQDPRSLGAVGLVLGSGGVLRHADPATAAEVVASVTADHAGGWRVPRSPRTGVDTAYLLFALGLLAQPAPAVATRLARLLADAGASGAPGRGG